MSMAAYVAWIAVLVVALGLPACALALSWKWQQGRRRLLLEDRAFWLRQAAQYDGLGDEIETAGGDAQWLRAKAAECRAWAIAREGER